MTVLRIEHKEHKHGPYTQGLTYRKFRYMHQTEAHPNAEMEGLQRTSDHYFGFKTMDQLHSWFSKRELNLLHKANFHVVTYRMLRTHMQYSKKQAIFIKEASRIIKVTSIKDLT